MPHDITLKNVVIWVTCVIKDDEDPQLFLEEGLFLKYNGNNMWWKNYAKKILVSEEELNDINFESLKSALLYIKK